MKEYIYNCSEFCETWVNLARLVKMNFVKRVVTLRCMWVKKSRGNLLRYSIHVFYPHFHFRWNNSNIWNHSWICLSLQSQYHNIFFFIGRWDRHVSVLHYKLSSFCSSTILLLFSLLYSFSFGQTHITPKYQGKHLFVTYIRNDEINIFFISYKKKHN